jgi:hypothetical protein
MSDRDLTHYKEEEVKARLDETRRARTGVRGEQ